MTAMDTVAVPGLSCGFSIETDQVEAIRVDQKQILSI